MSTPRTTQNRIQVSAQPFPDMKAARLSGFVFAVTIDLYHACRPTKLTCWVVPRLGRSNDRCIRYEKEWGSGPGEITNRRFFCVRFSVVRYDRGSCGNRVWVGQKEVSTPTRQLLTSIRPGLLLLNHHTW